LSLQVAEKMQTRSDKMIHTIAEEMKEPTEGVDISRYIILITRRKTFELFNNNSTVEN
jgi:hypothetical protein